MNEDLPSHLVAHHTLGEWLVGFALYILIGGAVGLCLGALFWVGEIVKGLFRDPRP